MQHAFVDNPDIARPTAFLFHLQTSKAPRRWASRRARAWSRAVLGIACGLMTHPVLDTAILTLLPNPDHLGMRRRVVGSACGPMTAACPGSPSVILQHVGELLRRL